MKRFAAEIPEAGWYGHPADAVKVERFWNGRAWTERTRDIGPDRVRGTVLDEEPLNDDYVWRFFRDRRRPAWGDLRAQDREAEISAHERRLRRKLAMYRRDLLEKFFIAAFVAVTIIFAYQLGRNDSATTANAAGPTNTPSVPVVDVGQWTFTSDDSRLTLEAGGMWRPADTTVDGETRFTVGPQNNNDNVRLRSSAGTAADLADAEKVAVDRIEESLPGAMVNDRRSTTLADGSAAVVLRLISSDADASSRRLVVIAASDSSLVEMVFASDSASRYESLELDVEERFLAATVS